jgi:hypothetical protein
VTSFPEASITASCPHPALIKINLAYEAGPTTAGVFFKQTYGMNSTICS